MTGTLSPTWACAPSARRRPSAPVSPCRPLSDPAVTPASRPPPCPPLRTSAGMTSSPTPRLGPSVVGVSATAERTPWVARTSASVATGMPGPAVVIASSPDRPALRSLLTAWSVVVELNSSVQLMATVSISGVLADEKRRVAVLRFDEARKPPTGEIRASGGPSIPAATRATIGPRQPTATTRNSAVISEVAAGACGGAGGAAGGRGGGGGGAGGRRDGKRRRRAGERHEPADDAAWAEQPRLDRRLGQRAVGRPPRRAPPGAEPREQRRDPPAAQGRRDRQQAGADREVRRRDAVPDQPVGERSAHHDPGPDARGRSDEADDDGLPGDHAPDLAGGPGHCSQERDLALALLDREAHRAGHDEDGDEQRQPAERGGDRDQRGPRLLAVRRLRLASIVPGEHRGAAG